MPHDVGASADLFVEAFLRVVGADLGPVLDGEGAEGQDVVGGVQQGDSDIVEAGLGQLVDDVTELFPGGLTVGLLEDRADQGGDHRPRRLRDPGRQVLR